MALISIAVPVYNGEALIAECLRVLQDQTFRDFEVLILDNASTDRTAAIAQGVVDHDPRFRLLRQTFNKGAMGNFIDGFAQARGRFYLFRAHDDLSDANYLEELVGRLQATPSAILAAGRVRTVALDGSRERLYAPPRLTGWALLDILILMFRSHAGWFYGVWDREAFAPLWAEMLRSFPHPWASDHLILFSVILDRAVAFSDRTTFTQRLKRLATMPRRRSPIPVAEMQTFRRDFHQACARQIDQRFAARPVQRAILRAALWFYTGKRVYRFRTVARRAMAERWGRPKPP